MNWFLVIGVIRFPSLREIMFPVFRSLDSCKWPLAILNEIT